MPNIAVIGAGLGGLPAAYELRHLLPRDYTVTLISHEPNFTFIPGLIQVALDLKPLEHIQLDLETLAQRHGLNWVSGGVTALDIPNRRITVADEKTIDYDYAMIATGASLAFDLIPGLGPQGGYTQSVCTPDHAIEARQAWLQFLDNPGPLVVGAVPGAGCFGPAYEFAFMAERELRRRGLRDQVPITYVTPEPYVGHLGVSGVKNAQALTAQLMQERGIEVIDNMTITAVEAEKMILANGQTLPFKYAMILPAFRGVQFVQDVPGLGDERGFIPVLPTQRHPNFPNIYAVGVSVELPQPDQTDIPIGLPKSGQMSEAMATAAAHNIAVDLGVIQAPLQIPTLDALCFAEFGDTGIAYIAAPVIPDPETGQRRSSYAVRGPWVVWAKAAFEKYFMLKMRYGVGMPWFEKLGLRALFKLKLFKSVLPEDIQALARV
ncbi:NADH dehydrogenase, FAD-containing subunit [Halomicronema hongdechloris C2206]|uniref:Sulfide-quinone reductase n=1 Tax=Halomicronema hongdechloris C2206 TaxID=1641165 RepID=A0A1Z3HSV0_9CYAN|nr:FAD-dependent oxidoreductase [Halomicronema hongdechloris]ASC73390.1 NADH dehydrogenase, FAD-containing subunit [Halomicronema hongdechloris C2206]